jgi:O-antigen ligase
VTVRHFVALLATSLFGIYLASRYDLPGQLRLVSISLGIVIGASIAACLAFPRYGIAPADILDEPAWQGVLTHKNTLGRLGVLAALILALYFLRRRRRLTILLGVLSLFLLVILTSSKTALVYFILGAAAFPFIRAFQRNPAQRKKILVLTAAVFGGVVGWVGYNWESFVATLGKDPTLTGRVALWAMSLDWIGEKPFLGYGYDAFWSAYYGPAADIRMAVNWLGAPHAHNGFINLWLDLGLVGVILFSAVFIQTYRLALSRAYASHTTEGIWPIAFLTFMFVYSLTEISFMSRTDLFWILFVSIMFGLRREAVQIRPRQPDPVRTR